MTCNTLSWQRHYLSIKLIHISKGKTNIFEQNHPYMRMCAHTQFHSAFAANKINHGVKTLSQVANEKVYTQLGFSTEDHQNFKRTNKFTG